ncbi:hypothetical protein HYS54_02495 [Candidatus Micrarchaeota archaeon]|nr:hypothetical protein [Candidatus Micrarchaeota archaeon]
MASLIESPVELLSALAVVIAVASFVALAHSRTRFFPSPFRKLLTVLALASLTIVATSFSRMFAVTADSAESVASALQFNILVSTVTGLLFLAAALLIIRLSYMYGLGGKPSAEPKRRR